MLKSSGKNNSIHNHQWLLSSSLDETLQQFQKITSVEITSDPANKNIYNVSDLDKSNKHFIKVSLQNWNKSESLLTVNLNLSKVNSYMLISLYSFMILLAFFMILISLQVALVFLIITTIIIVIWIRRRKLIELQSNLELANIILSELTKDVDFETINNKNY